MRSSRHERSLAFGLALVACSVLVAATTAPESTAIGQDRAPSNSALAPVTLTVNENVAPSDGLHGVSGLSSSVAEPITIGDAASLAAGETLKATESVSPSDAVVLVPGATLTVTERIVPTDNVALTPSNTAPAITLPGSLQVNEGSQLTLSGSFVDPDRQAWSGTIDWGDGSAVAALTLQSKAFQAQHVYADDRSGGYTITVRISDGTASTSATTHVDVANVAPQAALTAPSAPVNEGSPFTLSLGGVTDPSSVDTAAGFSYAFDCGDGAGYGSFGASAQMTCQTNDNGTRAVGARVKDKDAGISTYTATVVVANVAPTATFVAPVTTLVEGTSFTLKLTDPVDPSSADIAAGFTYRFDCGTGYGPPTASATVVCSAVDDPGVDVRATISDEDGASTEYTAHVTITNAAPSVQITAPVSGTAYPVGAAVTFTGAFTDPGVKDTHTAVWSFDTTTVSGAVTESGGSGSVSATYVFTKPGIYSVTLAVTDDDGGSAVASTVGGVTALVVVYDPSGGSAAGGGWVTDSGGRTQFSFEARYRTGSLQGVLQAHLSSGPALSASTLKWLVVAGSRAQLAGDATLDGVAGYSFLLTASTGPDAVRLKVWRASDGLIVYDTTPGAPDDIDLAAPKPLGGGAITIRP